MTGGPASQVVAQAQQSLTVTDAEGRTLVLRRMGALDRLRLFKAVGPSLAQNPPYLGMAMLASSVCVLDGVPIPPPATEAQVEALISRLGDVGIAAAAEALRPDQPAAEQRETVENLAGN